MKKRFNALPDSTMVRQEIERVRYRSRYWRVLKTTVYALVIVAALAMLIATLWLPVLQIYGGSMTPTMRDGEIIFTVKVAKPQRGDILAFYHNNKILVRRVIGLPGETVEMDPDGRVYIDGELLEEPYLEEWCFGDADTEMPCRVPDNMYFVMGDNRATAVDSRHVDLGCVFTHDLIGKLVFRIWPLEQFGGV